MLRMFYSKPCLYFFIIQVEKLYITNVESYSERMIVFVLQILKKIDKIVFKVPASTTKNLIFKFVSNCRNLCNFISENVSSRTTNKVMLNLDISFLTNMSTLH